MKRKTLLVLLVSICILTAGIVLFAIWDLWEEIETINIFRRDFSESIVKKRIPPLIGAIINMVFSSFVFFAVLILTVVLFKRERLVLNPKERQEEKARRTRQRQERKERTNRERHQQKIEQLTAKLAELKEKGDE